ncbi:MAG TPA: sigma-70 family RNA polymerase sigma factor [Blastocatellia bacterium]|jgi:RNA polymerase sigma-70 factor (ECF subfamily)|nr:sigma-70 family RNA polymerase sigma factor [Blastocatellia bacterium]
MSAGDMAALEQNSLAGLEIDTRAIEYLPEARLISRLRAGDLAAFEELVAHFERPVFALCFRLLGDAEEARDAAQETFLKIYRGLSGFRGEAGLKTWIYRIAINQAMNQKRWWRRRHRDETISLDITRGQSEATLGSMLPGRGSSPEAEAISSEREHSIMHALGEIKEEYRIALMLREIEELSYEEIAETLSISIGTVKSRIARGREELRRRVKDLI